MTIELNWLTGKPTLPDLYFVAVELGTWVGKYDLASWDGEKWDHACPENIIGFVPFTDLKAKLDVNWPKAEPAMPKIEIRNEDKGGWEEVE